MSFFANVLIIKDSNPAGEETRPGTSLVTKETSKKSFFNLVWKTLYRNKRDRTGQNFPSENCGYQRLKNHLLNMEISLDFRIFA